MRSMRSRTSSAGRPGSTANGSTGARRKRDFVFIRGYSATDLTGHGCGGPTITPNDRFTPRRCQGSHRSSNARSVAFERSHGDGWICVSRGLKGVANAGKESRARAIPGRITRPRSTAGERHRQVMTEHEIERQFAADRCAEVRELELPIPGVTSVEKGGRVNAPEEERPVADATLRTRE